VGDQVGRGEVILRRGCAGPRRNAVRHERELIAFNTLAVRAAVPLAARVRPTGVQRRETHHRGRSKSLPSTGES
jgi:hypothetical protein